MKGRNDRGVCCGEDRLLRTPEVIEMTGISRATIYRKMAEGLFPQSVRLGPNAVAWRLSEILAWIASRPRAKEALSIA